MNKAQIKNPPSNVSNIINHYPLNASFIQKKYSSFYYSYSHIQINNLIFNEKSHITSKFKDFLVIDDNTEFFRRFYSKEENPSRLKRIYSFYSTYSKIFPNYMILPESKYLYRNIRRKQRMIDAFNQIKREEEENRHNLNIGKKNNKEGLVIFDQSIQRSIIGYEPSHLKSKVNMDDDSICSCSISLSLKRYDNYYITAIYNNTNESNASLAHIIGVLNDDAQYDYKGSDILIETPKKTNDKVINYGTSVPFTKAKDSDSNENKNEQHTLSALNNNRKFISHKAAISNPDLHNQNKKIQIINNYHNIILPEGLNAIININTNYYQCPINDNDTNNRQKSNNKSKEKSKSPIQKEKKLFHNTEPVIIATTRQKSTYLKNISISKHDPNNNNTTKKEMNNIESKFKDLRMINSFKSPEKKLSTCPISLAKTKTLSTHTQMIPFFKNKSIVNTMTELQNKVNPFKIKFDNQRKYQLKNNFASVSSNSLSKKSYDIHAEIKKKNDIKMAFATEGDKDKSETHTDIEAKVTKAEMKNRYKLFMENAKKDLMITLRNSCETTSKKQSTTIDALSKRKYSKVFTSNSTQKQQQYSKITIQKKLLFSPQLFKYNTNNNTNTSSNTNTNKNSNINEHKSSLTTTTKITHKIISKKDKPNNTSTAKITSNTGIKSINFKALNVNTSKMKFIKK